MLSREQGAAVRAGAPGSAPPPSGVVTFLLSDVVGSTALWERSAAAMDRALARHDELIADCVGSHGGWLLKAKGEGDSTFSVFVRATDAVAAAVACQRRLAAEVWPQGAALRVRTAISTGEAVERDGDYYGMAVNRAARLRALAGGGDVYVAQSTAELVVDHLPDGLRLKDLGEHALQGLARPEHIWQLVESAVDQRAAAHEAEVVTMRATSNGPWDRLEGPFVGRAAALASALEAVEGGFGGPRPGGARVGGAWRGQVPVGS